MLKTISIFILSLVPSLLYFLIIRKAKQRWEARLRRIRAVTTHRRRVEFTLSEQQYDLDNHSYFIGELSCRFNARSPYLRCAVNPSGPCENCVHYELRQ